MRISDLVESTVTEGINRTLHVGNFEVAMLDHAVKQMRDRGIRFGEVDRILKKMLRYSEEISQMDDREGFFVIHHHKKISLGIAKMPGNKLALITAIDTETPYAKSVDKSFDVN